MHKASFISIIGLPNAGKSTLLNAILKEELVITTPKAQTTRHRIQGILSTPEYQLVFSDTPGIIENAAYKLQQSMMDAVVDSLGDADILLVLLNGESPDLELVSSQLKDYDQPKVVVLNKIDLLNQDEAEELLEQAKELFKTEYLFGISAKEKFNLDALVKCLVDLSPEHPAYYDKEHVSDKDIRFLVSEIIREQILLQFSKEIPYSTEVAVTDYKEAKKLDKIYATIFVERDSQKVIILGRGGSAIKKLGTKARIKMERFLGKKVFLSLTVKVRKDWRKDDLQLQRFGYKK